MYKIDIINEITRVKNILQELEFKALFYNQPLSEKNQLTYVEYDNMLTGLYEELNKINNA